MESRIQAFAGTIHVNLSVLTKEITRKNPKVGRSTSCNISLKSPLQWSLSSKYHALRLHVFF